MAAPKKTVVEDTKTYHQCDYCDDEFVCPEGKVEWCDCRQLIIGLAKTKDRDISSRLAFWCSDKCADADFPVDDSDDDGNGDTDFENLTYDLLRQTIKD